MPNPQAEKLNEAILKLQPEVMHMLSERGKNIFFPSKGILGQSAQARGKKINATIGIALEEDGSPMRLPSVAKQLPTLEPKDVFPYAPSYGKPELRKLWREMIYKKNPGLEGKEISDPVAACALTHALSICGYLFIDPGDKIITPDLYWGNYNLAFKNAYQAQISTYSTFQGDGLDLAAFENALGEGATGKRIVLLNFPNNPAGYTATLDEAKKICELLVKSASAGNHVVVLIDDAYFGLVYEDGVCTESIFADLADAHERILAVKIDGATKEDYVWGFRVGFITCAVRGGNAALYSALEAKLAGAIRGNLSNISHVSQSLLLAAYRDPAYDDEKREKYEILKKRYEKVRSVLRDHPEYKDAFEAMPFNSGYFMCVRPKGDPEKIRGILLEQFSTGVIATGSLIRLAFSATPLDQIEELFENLYRATLKA